MAEPFRALRLVVAPPHRAGMPFIAGGLALAAFGLFVHWTLLVTGLVFAAFCLFFFRDPARVSPARPDAIVAAADGRILEVGLAIPPEELGIGAAPRVRIATFLSILDVHINRWPASGRVARIVYRAGRFLDASDGRAGAENERNGVVLELPDGTELGVVQIAGLVARRIICAARAGDDAIAGDRFGLIRFGSRTDVWLPEGATPLVRVGQTSIGGETVLALLPAVATMNTVSAVAEVEAL